VDGPHRDIGTTQRFADYAPSTWETELIVAAFGRSVVDVSA